MSTPVWQIKPLVFSFFYARFVLEPLTHQKHQARCKAAYCGALTMDLLKSADFSAVIHRQPRLIVDD
jgi:hypothetical protein